jgi:hypothetical protein
MCSAWGLVLQRLVLRSLLPHVGASLLVQALRVVLLAAGQAEVPDIYAPLTTSRPPEATGYGAPGLSALGVGCRSSLRGRRVSLPRPEAEKLFLVHVKFRKQRVDTSGKLPCLEQVSK